MGHVIKCVKGREILDSRGNPTVEAVVIVKDSESGVEYVGMADTPSGASTGKFEALELRDGGRRYNGNGVLKAAENVNIMANDAIAGSKADTPEDLYNIDQKLIAADKTKNKSKMGANAMLAVSMACARAIANANGKALYEFFGEGGEYVLPVPMMNILNGGAHSDNLLDVQEFMILPVGAQTMADRVRWCSEVYHSLKRILKERGLSIAVGDEGGFAPHVETTEEALDLIMEAIEAAGYVAGHGRDFLISIDAAASEWKGDNNYHLPKKNVEYTTQELIEYWKKLAEKYPIFSIEDPLDEEDWEGWQELTRQIGEKTVLVGDDLFVTNACRLQKGIDMKAANAILIKPNQIGTLTETFDAIKLAKEKGFFTIMSHRSGETEDTIIADLAVGLATTHIKTGAPCRGERTAKYNRLIRIEEEIS